VRSILCISALASLASAQDAQFGIAGPGTVSFFTSQSHRAPNPGNTVTGAFRATFYPTLKLGEHWFAYGALQAHSTPYFYEELSSRNHQIRFSVLQAYVGYSRVRDGRSLTVKAGQLTSAFGSFPLRYDDARNWTIDLPQPYGYYYFPVTVYGLPGAEINATFNRIDARIQLTNSSPSNPREWWERDQYANWTLGAGYTIRQGFRIGASAVRGPYLHRQHRFFRPGEAAPRTLPALGYGVDLQWARGKWNVNVEAQRFQYPYRVMPYFFQTFAYGEVKWNVRPRLYLAGRAGTRWRSGEMGHDQAYEFVAGFRPAPGHLMKLGYLALDAPSGARGNVLGIQYVYSFNPPALAWNH
jgi:hypothetical protein